MSSWRGRRTPPRPGVTPFPPQRANTSRTCATTGWRPSGSSSRTSRRSEASGAHRPLDSAIDELVRPRRLACRDDAVVMRREPADRIGGSRVACQPQRLAAAAAEVDLLSSERARPARLLHPVGPPEARERVRLAPDPLERMLADVCELEPRDRRRRLAGQNVAVRSNHDRGPAPAAHAWLRQVLVEVGKHPEDVDLWADSLAEALDGLLRAPKLLPGREQRFLVRDRPAVVLRVGQLEPLRPEIECELEHLLDPIEVLPVKDAVY